MRLARWLTAGSRSGLIRCPQLTRKDNLIKNLKRIQRQLQREGREEEAQQYDFFPGTYVLPADYGLFVEEFKQQRTRHRPRLPHRPLPLSRAPTARRQMVAGELFEGPSMCALRTHGRARLRRGRHLDHEAHRQGAG